MKNIYKLLIITGVFLVSLIIIVLISNITYVLKYKDVEYYKIGHDQIPSIYKVLGERKLYYYKSNNNSITLKYKNIKDVKSDLNNYIDFLVNNHSYVYTTNIDLSNDKGNIKINTNSIEDNKLINININYDINNYEIIITKDEGKINFYK